MRWIASLAQAARWRWRGFVRGFVRVNAEGAAFCGMRPARASSVPLTAVTTKPLRWPPNLVSPTSVARSRASGPPPDRPSPSINAASTVDWVRKARRSISTCLKRCIDGISSALSTIKISAKTASVIRQHKRHLINCSGNEIDIANGCATKLTVNHDGENAHHESSTFNTQAKRFRCEPSHK